MKAVKESVVDEIKDFLTLEDLGRFFKEYKGFLK